MLDRHDAGQPTRVALRLLDVRRDALVLLLGLDNRQRLEPDEEDVVGDAVAVVLAVRRDLGDRAVLALFRPRALRPAQRLAVDLPARCAELRIDEYTGVGLVELRGLGRRG